MKKKSFKFKKKLSHKYKKTIRKPKILGSTKKKYLSKSKHNKSKKQNGGAVAAFRTFGKQAAPTLVKQFLPAVAHKVSTNLSTVKPLVNPLQNIKSTPIGTYKQLIPINYTLPQQLPSQPSFLNFSNNILKQPRPIITESTSKSFNLIKESSPTLFHLDKPDETQSEKMNKLMKINIPLLNNENILKYAWTIPNEVKKTLEFHDEEKKSIFEKIFKAKDDYYKKLNTEYTPNFNFSNASSILPMDVKQQVVKIIQQRIVEKNREIGETRTKLFNVETIQLIDKINTDIQTSLAYTIIQNNIPISIKSYQGMPDYFIYTPLEYTANNKKITSEEIVNDEFIEESVINTKKYTDSLSSTNISCAVNIIKPLQQHIKKENSVGKNKTNYKLRLEGKLLGTILFSYAENVLSYSVDSVKSVFGYEMNPNKDYGLAFELGGLIYTAEMMQFHYKEWKDISTQNEFNHHLLTTIDYAVETVIKDVTEKGSEYYLPLVANEVLSPLAIQSIKGWMPDCAEEDKDKFFKMNFQFIDSILPGFLKCLRNGESVVDFITKPEVKKYVDDYIDNGSELTINIFLNSIRSGIQSELDGITSISSDDPEFEALPMFLNSDELQYKSYLESSLEYVNAGEIKTVITDKMKTSLHEFLNKKLETLKNDSQNVNLNVKPDSVNPEVKQYKKEKLDEFKKELHMKYLAEREKDPNAKVPITEFIMDWAPAVWSLIDNINENAQEDENGHLIGTALFKSIKIDLYSITETIALIVADPDFIEIIEKPEVKNSITDAGEGILSKDEILHALTLITSDVFVKKYKNQIIDLNKEQLPNIENKELVSIIYAKLYLDQ